MLVGLALACGWLWLDMARPQDAARAAPPAAEQNAGAIRVPAGFVVERVAEPPLIEHPMMACFDERGRLFVAEAAGVNRKADLLLKELPNRIRLLEDTDGDGRFDRSTIFADKMTFPMGVLWHDGAVFAASAPSLWRLQDTTGKGVADQRKELVTKFGFIGNAADIHGPFLGPDGWLYWTDGRHGHEIIGPDGHVLKGEAARVFRCRPDGHDVEAVCGGGMDDPVEIAFTPEGEALATVDIFLSRPSRIDTIVHCVWGGVFPYYEQVLHEFQRTGDLLPAAVNLGWCAPSGLMRYRDTALGKQYRDNLFSAQFNTHKIQRHVLTRTGGTFRGTSEDFLVSPNVDFHPTDVLEDADGSLLVLDTGSWFSHCPTSQIARPVPGAIYRVRRAGAPRVADPRGLKIAWERLTPQELAGLLDDPRFMVRDWAVHLLGKRGAAAVPVLRAIVASGASVRARRNAVWAATRSDTSAARAVARTGLNDKDPSVRNAAAHSIGLYRDAAALPRLLDMVVKDPSPAVRREAATALGRMRRPTAVPALLAGLGTGGDRFVEHALIYALLEIADREATLPGLHAASPQVQRATLIALDQMDGGKLTRALVTPFLEADDLALRQTAWSLVTARPEWAAEVLAFLRQWLAGPELSEARRDMLRTALLAFPRNPAVQELIDQGLRRWETPRPTRLLLLETIAQMPLERLPATWIEDLNTSVAQGDERIARQAVATIRTRGAAREFDAALQQLAANAQRPAELRVAALGAVSPGTANLDEAFFHLLIGRLDANQPPLTRLAAARALGNARLNDGQLDALLKLVSAAGALELSDLLGAYERSGNPSLGKNLLAALDGSAALPSVAPATLRRVVQAYPGGIRQLAGPLLQRLELDLGKQRALLASLEPVLAKGDPKRGREVFFGHQAACSSCHRIGSEGGRVGPDLSTIGAIRSGRDLLESIVLPSASIVRGYEPYVITTRDGRVYSGIIVRETPDAVYLVNADRTEMRIARSAVDSLERSRVSIMPQGLEAQLSREDLANLIAYLQTLR
jgi:putative heme-binding domain-containing protein